MSRRQSRETARLTKVGSPKYLLDTDTLSNYLGRSTQYPKLVEKLSTQPAESMATCVVVAGEMIHGSIEALRKESRPERMVERYDLTSRILHLLASLPVLPFDAAAAAEYGELPATVGRNDRKIAAIALSQGLIVVTRNLTDFCRIQGLSVEDWHDC